ncbi:MAG TPA: cyclic peptide export ABC transporter [Pyrinomonadaceae bacterium]
MKIISFIFRYSKRTFILAAFAGAIAGISSAGLLALLMVALRDEPPASLTLAWYFAGLLVVSVLANLFSRFLLIKISQQVPYELRLRLSRQAFNVPLRKFEEIGSHRILAILTQDMSTIAIALLDFPVFCVNLAMAVGCLIYLCWLSPIVFAAFTFILIVTMTSLQLVNRAAGRHLKRARDDWDVLLNHIRSLLDGTKELRLNRQRREAFFSELMMPRADSFRRNNSIGRQMLGVNAAGSQALYFIFIGLLVYGLPRLWPISSDTLIAYALAALYLRTPMTIVLDIIPSFNNANISLTKVEETGLSFAGTDAVSEAAVDPEPTCQQLELSEVTHVYKHESGDGDFLLGPLSMTLRQGELVFLVGGNGSGKTTLAKLITGLYIPESGEIRFDGTPVTEQNRESYRQLFSIVFSTPHLFERLMGHNRLTVDQQAGDYLSKLQLDHKVKVKDGVLSTTDLSQGQRKRLALLTAYLDDRPVYIFDEWAADQDPLFKQFFYLHLLPELKARGKMILVISHDDRYFSMADRIIKLEQGKIVEDALLGVSAYAPSTLPASL